MTARSPRAPSSAWCALPIAIARVRGRLRARGSGEQGFTLPELLMAVALLGIIITPLTISFMAGLRIVGRADQKFTDSRSALISAQYFATDVAGANTITVGGAACGGGTAAVTFGAPDAAAGKGAPDSRTASYVVEGTTAGKVRLLRLACVGGVQTGRSVAAVALATNPVTVRCYDAGSTTAGPCGTTTRRVAMDVTAAPNLGTPNNPNPAPFAFRLDGTRRQR